MGVAECDCRSVAREYIDTSNDVQKVWEGEVKSAGTRAFLHSNHPPTLLEIIFTPSICHAFHNLQQGSGVKDLTIGVECGIIDL